MKELGFEEFIKWINYFSINFYKISGLLLSYILLILFVILPTHRIIKNDYNYERLTYLSIYIFLFIYWFWFRFKYPKNKKGKTGLVIAIYARDVKELQLKKLFINELKKDFNEADLHQIFEIIELKNHLSKDLNRDDLEKLHKKIKGHIYYYGDILEEQDGKIKRDFLNINGCVKHQPIPMKIGNELAYDFRQLLPQDINFDSFFGMRGVKATAKIAFLTTKYVTGVASFLSGNPLLAFRLHNNLIKELDGYRNIGLNLVESKSLTSIDYKYLNKIKAKIPYIISNECFMLSKYYYEIGNIKGSREYLKLSFQNNNANSNTWLLKSVYDFVLDNNPKESLDSTKKAEKYSKAGGVWEYNRAFLFFWLEQYQDAWSMCQKILKSSYKGEERVVEEVKNFNLVQLKKYPDKIQLYFWLGFIQYKKAINIPAAFEYFNNFVQQADKNLLFLKEKACSFLVEIRKTMESNEE